MPFYKQLKKKKMKKKKRNYERNIKHNETQIF